MEETIEDMDKEIELKDNIIYFSSNKIGISDEKIIQAIERIKLTEVLDKADRV